MRDKSNMVRDGFEKDDRHRIDDQRRWILGYDNHEKVELYKREVLKLHGEMEEFKAGLQKVESEMKKSQHDAMKSQSLVYIEWNDVDTQTVLHQVFQFKQQLKPTQRKKWRTQRPP